MSYSNELDSNNKDLQVILDTINGLPEAGGVELNNQNKTITENGTYTADEGYTGLGTVTVDVQASGENKLALLAKDELREITAADLSGVTAIRKYSFYYADYINHVEIPEGVTSIGDYAFARNTDNTSAEYGIIGQLILPHTLTSLGRYAFSGHTNLKELYINGSLTVIPEYAFQYHGLQVLHISNGVKTISTCAFKASTTQGRIRSLSLPEGLETIGREAFQGAIGKYASETSINIPQSVTTIGSSAFDSCKKLVNVTLPEQLTSIGLSIFQGSGLTSIEIPSKVTNIANAAFNNCTDLSDVIMKSEVPPTLGLTSFNNCTALVQIIVPVGCAEAYKAATNWANYADIIVEEGSV